MNMKLQYDSKSPDPSPKDIVKDCALIRSKWSPSKCNSRKQGPKTKHWTAPVIRLSVTDIISQEDDLEKE